MDVIRWDIIRFGSIPSTMDEIDRLAREGAAEGTVVVADEQTAGRGRAGRTWSAPSGSSLLCSVLLRPDLPPERISALPLLVGVAVAEAIEAVAPVRCELKWPNDVWIDGLKVAGVLLQSRLSTAGVGFLNVGMGINISTDSGDLPDGATSIQAACGVPVERERLLNALLARLEAQYTLYRNATVPPDLSAWSERAVYLGEEVVVMQDGAEVRGVLEGVSSRGGLLLRQSEGGLNEVVQGDLTRGPRPAP